MMQTSGNYFTVRKKKCSTGTSPDFDGTTKNGGSLSANDQKTPSLVSSKRWIDCTG